MKLSNSLLGFTLVLAISAPPAFSGEPVTGVALKKLVSGFEGTNGGFMIAFSSNGNVKMVDGSDVYEGTWYVTSDSVCTEIKALRNGAPTCRTVTDEGGGRFKMTRADNGKSLNLVRQ